jgi:hypothetical protein
MVGPKDRPPPGAPIKRTHGALAGADERFEPGPGGSGRVDQGLLWQAGWVQTGHLIDGRYRIEQRLGNGGMATVYRARDQVLDRPVAVKVLAGPQATAPAARERIRAEARSVARLSHPNVTNVYDYGEADHDGVRLPYVVMELLSGRTLAERLSDGPVPVPAALRICAEVAGALGAAHAEGIVHRDVKPSNVMLTPSGAKVMDFGIAATAGRAERETDGQLLGTPAYLAPERLLGDQVLPASDVYALGLLAYRLFAGRSPWAAETTTQMLRSHVYLEPTPMPALRGVPGEVHRILGQCLAKDPAERPSATDVAQVLAVAAGLPPPPDDGVDGLSPPADQDLGGPRTGDTATLRLPALPVGPAGRRRRARVLAAATTAAALVAALLVVISLNRANGPGSAALDGAGAAATPSTGPGPGSAGPSAAPTPSLRSGPPSGTTARASPLAPSRSSAAPTLPGFPLTTLGGVVLVDCDGSTARVVGLNPTPGYAVKDYDPGPADEVQVVLLSERNKTEVKVKCEDGEPIPRIKEDPQ